MISIRKRPTLRAHLYVAAAVLALMTATGSAVVTGTGQPTAAAFRAAEPSASAVRMPAAIQAPESTPAPATRRTLARRPDERSALPSAAPSRQHPHPAPPARPADARSTTADRHTEPARGRVATADRHVRHEPHVHHRAATASGWGCGAALAYLREHAAPGFRLACPGDANGHQAMTCVYDSSCPGYKLIAISDPCPAAYRNEASNSWVLLGRSDAAIDPFGSCS